MRVFTKVHFITEIYHIDRVGYPIQVAHGIRFIHPTIFLRTIMVHRGR